MGVALATLKSLPVLAERYGPLRKVLHFKDPTDIPREQHKAFTLNVLGGKTIRESVIKGSDGRHDLIIRLAEFIDPVTLTLRYAADYWSIRTYWTVDHALCAMAETVYEDAVRAEFANPTLPLSIERFSRGLASFYDDTDVQP